MYVGVIDLQKAFDTVQREALFYKLERVGVSDKMVRALKGVYRKVECGIQVSRGKVIGDIRSRVGLKQGCKLSPILFLLFINEILEEIEKEGIGLPSLEGQDIPGLVFADDILLMSITPRGIQKSLDKIVEYCERWGLTVNQNKTKVMVCKKGTKLGKGEKWWIKGEEIKVVNRVEYLGIILTGRNNWKDQIKRAKMRGLGALAGITSINKSLPDVEIRIQKNYYKAVVVGKVLYGAELWGADQRGKELETIPARFIKIMLGLPLCTANCGVRKMGEGISMQGDLLGRVLGYWRRLEKGEGGEVLQKAFKWQKENQGE